MFSKSILSIGSFTALFALTGVAAQAQTAINPILEYNFNDTTNTTTTVSTGSDTTALNFIKGSGTGGTGATLTSVDLHSASGTSVSGLAADYSFNNTSVSTMVSGTNPTLARNAPAATNTSTNPPGGPSSLNGLASFSVTGWFKTDGTQVLGGGNNTRLVSDASNAAATNNQGFYLSGTNAGTGGGTLQFSITAAGGTQQLLNSSPQAGMGAFANDKGIWTFFAATYDSTSASGNNTFLYRGTSDGTLTVIGQGRITAGPLAANPDTFGLGNIVSQSSSAFLQRDFDGFMDDVRVYGASDNTAALSLAQLQTVQTADLANMQPVLMTPVAPAPEPSQTAVLGIGLLGLAGLALRAQKRQALTA